MRWLHHHECLIWYLVIHRSVISFVIRTQDLWILMFPSAFLLLDVEIAPQCSKTTTQCLYDSVHKFHFFPPSLSNRVQKIRDSRLFRNCNCPGQCKEGVVAVSWGGYAAESTCHTFLYFAYFIETDFLPVAPHNRAIFRSFYALLT
jgi:hypothetical protein